MATNLATAYIEVMPSMRGFEKKIKSSLGDVEVEAGKSGKKSGGIMAGGMAGMLKKGLKVAGVASVAGGVGSVAGAAFVKGFGRLNALDQAEAKLRGLGRSAEDITSIMDSVNSSVKGTAFGLDEAANSAAVFSTVGVKSGEEMDRAMKLLADTTAQSGTSFSEMTPIFAKIRAEGGLNIETFDQLNERATGVGEALSQHLGIPMEEVREKAKDIDFETFAEAMEKNIGGAAQETGKTFKGAWDNMNAALGRVGAKLLEPLFDAAPAVFGKITTGIDSVNKLIGPATEQVSEFVKSIFSGDGDDSGGGIFGGIRDSISSIREAIGDIDFAKVFDTLKQTLEDLRPTFDMVVGFVGGALKVAFETIGGLIESFVNHGKNIWTHLKGPLESLGNTVREQILPVFRDLFEWAQEQLPKFQGAFDAVRRIFDVLSPVVARLAGVAFGALGVALKVIWVVLKPVISVLKWLAGIVFTVISAGLRGLATVLEAIGPAWQAMKDALSVAWTWISETLWPGMKDAFAAIGEAASTLWVEYIQPAWEAISGALGTFWTWISETLWPGIQSVLGFIGGVFIGLWQTFIAPAWAGIRAAIGVVWNWISGTLWPGMQMVFQVIGSVVTWLWQNVFAPAWSGISAAIGVVWNWISGTLWPGMQSVFQAIGSVVTWLWQNAIVPAWSGIQGAISIAGDVIRGVTDRIRGFFQSIADKAGEIKSWITDRFTELTGFISSMPGKISSAASGMFNGIRDAFRDAINWIISKWNSLELSLDLPFGGGTVSIGTPNIPLFRDGGRVHGPGTGTSDSILARLSKGEFVVNAQATQDWLPLLAAINGGMGTGQTGGLPAFAEGGLVGADDLLNFARGHESMGKKHNRSLEGAPYIWGGGSKSNWGDCSGAMSMLAAFVLGRNPFQRYFATGNQEAWIRANGGHIGRPPTLRDVFAMGWFNGGPYGGHTAGSIFGRSGATHVEMGGGRGNGQIGGPAAAWDNGQFTNHGYFRLRRSEPLNVQVRPDGADGSWGGGEYDDSIDASGYGGTTSATSTSETKRQEKSLSAIYGDAMQEQAKDLLGFFSIPDSPSLLEAYSMYEEDKEKFQETPEGKQRRFEFLTKERLDAHNRQLAEVDEDFSRRIEEASDAAEKRKLREQLAARKSELNRLYEESERDELRKHEENMRGGDTTTRPANATPRAASLPDFSEGDGDEVKNAPAPPPDPNKPPHVAWKKGDGAQPWRPVLEWAIDRVGRGLTKSAPQVQAGIKQIGSESGGDPNISQQIVDVNGTGDAAGVGLLQIIPSTWKANRDPALPDDRRNGPANIVGALRYYVGRYGSDLTSRWGRGIGYKLGGYTGDYGTNEVAGHVHGREFVINADATKVWRPTLEAINAGARPAAPASFAGGPGGAAYSPVTNVTVRDEHAFHELQKRRERLTAARMK